MPLGRDDDPAWPAQGSLRARHVTTRRVEAATDVEPAVREACYVERAAMKPGGECGRSGPGHQPGSRSHGSAPTRAGTKADVVAVSQACPLIKARRLGEALAM